MPINDLLELTIGSTRQWVRLRGKDRSNPLLLVLQTGPGLPAISEASVFQRLLGIEDEFVVAYWDQRACGKSFSAAIPPESLTLERMRDDAHELLDALFRHLNLDQAYLLGFSFGGTVATLLAAKCPGHVRALIAVGLDIDFAAAEQVAYTFAVQRALDLRNSRAQRELDRIGPPPHLNAKRFGTRAKWVMNFGGVNRNETYTTMFARTVWRLVRAPEYSPREVIGSIRGITFCQEHLLPNVAALNLREQVPRLEIPLFMLQGRLDYTTPPAIAERYFGELQAPHGKRLIWFEASAHMPHFEEPERFRRVLLDIKAA